MWLSVWDKTVSEFTVWNTPIKQGADEWNLFRWKNRKTFGYTWSEQSFTVPADWYYILECWGASWGNDNRWNLWGRWWYAKWKLYLTAWTILKIYVWEKWKDNPWWLTDYAFNGWWRWWRSDYRSSNRWNGWWGWWTDIRIWWNTLYHRLIVWWGWGWASPNQGWNNWTTMCWWWEQGNSPRSWAQWTQTDWNAFWVWFSSNCNNEWNRYSCNGWGGWWYGWWKWWNTSSSDSWSDSFYAWGWSWFVWEGQDTVPSGYLVSEDYVLDEIENIKWNEEMPNTTWTWTMTWNVWNWCVVISFSYGSKSEKITQAGIYHNEELWLISMSADGENWITIDDKNAGARSSDIEDELSYWWYFQFWNSHGFGELPEPTPPWPRLPNEYQEVEYIESTWTQYIDTWYNTTNDIKIEARVMFNRKYDSNVLFWTTLNSWSYWDCLCYLSANRWFQAWAYDTDVYWTNWDANIDYEVIYTLSSVTLNLDTKTYSVSARWNRLTIMYWNTLYSELKLYSFKIYTWTTLIRDFVPCFRKSDWEVWLYDLVNNQFYTNSWTWDFVKWPNVFPEDWWQPWENTLLYMPLNWDVFDYSWNNNDGTITWTIEQRAIWIWDRKYAYFNNDSAIWLVSIPVWTWNAESHTFCCWAKVSPNWICCPFFMGTDSNGQRYSLNFNYWTSSFQHIMDVYWAPDVPLSPSMWSKQYVDQWVHVVYTYDKSTSTHTLYLNAIQSGSSNLRGLNIWNNNKYIWRAQAENWYWLSEIIFEQWIWTQQQIDDHFNLTKSAYWIN